MIVSKLLYGVLYGFLREWTFDYFLCLGIVDNSLEIVNNNGNVELVPILDDNNNPLWDVIEDTENEDLTHEIENIIKELKNNS